MSDATLNDPSRREFVALSAAAGLAVATRSGHAAAAKVVEQDVEIRTPDGVSDAAFFHPATGTSPAVLVWTDIFGLRPTFRELGRRLAGEGYAVLVPNPFYRTQKAPVFQSPAGFNFQSEADRAKLPPLTGPLNAPGAAERDAQAYIEWLDGQKSVNRAKKIGTQGYCMGGPLVMKTAATVPGRVGAGASFHGGGLVSDRPDSPHLLIPKMKASLLIAVASNDDERQPEAKDVLKKAFADAKVTAEVEVFPALHGWCVPDMPAREGKPIYDKPEAERAWGKLLALYRKALA